MRIFTLETTRDLLEWIQGETGNIITFALLSPDHEHLHAGERVTCNNQTYRYRSYRSLVDLAEIAQCRMLTPERLDACCVIIRFARLETTSSFHYDAPKQAQEKYGADSAYAAITKSEEPSFLEPFLRALHNVKLETRRRILDLGINSGDEFEVMRRHVGDTLFNAQSYVGIDHSASAIALARERFGSNVALHVSDINAIDALSLEPFDLIVSIGTLQSPGINMKPFLMHLVQNYLNSNGALILGFPNCRWMDGEMLYGAKAPNYSFSEQSLLYNDVMFCKKYLQQHKFRVTLTGKHYLFLTATKIGQN